MPDPVTSSDAALLRRVAWRILPLLVLLYLVAYLDRVNIGFAAASMQRSLGFSDTLYGTGAGLFFVGYLAAQVPGSLVLARFGARRTLSALMIVWGSVSAATAFVHSAAMFLSLRLLLGAAEAAFYPGVIFYLTTWLPRRVRSSAIAWFLFAIPLASVFGGPVSSAILAHGRVGRFADWQVLLLGEALPAIVLGALLPWAMSDTPEQARWLAPDDRLRLATLRAQEEPSESGDRPGIDARLVMHVVRFAAIYFTVQLALYAQSFWLPKILHNLGVPVRAVGWQIAIVYAVSAAGMLVWSRVADHAPNARWTLAVPLIAAAAGYAATTVAHAHAGGAIAWPLLLAFGLGAAGALAATPPFWQQVTLGTAAAQVAGAIALINALGNLGGFAGPALFGRLQQSTGSYAAGMLTAAGALLVGTALLYARTVRQGGGARMIPDKESLR